MTLSRRTIIALAAATSIVIAAPSAIAQSAGSTLPASSNNEGGVQIVVKPERVGAGPEWTFGVTMNTHTKPLDNDMTKAAVLIDDAGKRYSPLSWQGDKPGHHRKGTLTFPAPAKQPNSFELRIDGVGGVQSRIFKWTMK